MVARRAAASARTVAGSPRADARRNRARVLEAAQKAFSAKGLSVPLDEIARLAGVGAGTVYRHFPSKEVLYEAVIQDRLEQLADDARAMTTADDPGEAFFAVFSLTVERASFNRALCEALAAGPGVRFEAAPEVKNRYLAALEVLLGRAQRAGAVRSDVNVEDVRKVMVGCMAMEQQGGSPGRATAIVCDGLRPGGRGTERVLPSVTKHDAMPARRNETKVLDNEIAMVVDASRCEMCGTSIRPARTGRPPRYCGPACRQKAHRRRSRAGLDS